MTGPAISVLLVDDHAVVREGYGRLLELSPDVRVAGEAADATQAYQRFCALHPDVVVMDLALPATVRTSPIAVVFLRAATRTMRTSTARWPATF